MSHDGLHAFAVGDCGGEDDGLAGFRRIRLVLHPRASGRSAGRSNGVLCAGRGARAAFRLTRQCERNIHREIATIERGIDRLHSDDVFPLGQKARGIVDAHFFPIPGFVLQRKGLQRESACRDVQPGDLMSVDPHHAAIIHTRPKEQHGGQFLDAETMTKERAAVAAQHIAEHRRIIIVAVAKACLPRLPSSIFFEVARRPCAGLGVSLAPLPPAAEGRQKDARFGRGQRVAKSRCPPMSRPRSIRERVDTLQRRPDARTGGRPWETSAIFDLLDKSSAGIGEHELFALIAQLPRKRPERFHSELFLQRRRILRDHEVSSRVESRANGEDEFIELPAIEFRRSIARIEQLYELQRALAFRVKMNLVDQHALRTECAHTSQKKQPSLQTNHALNIRIPSDS